MTSNVEKIDILGMDMKAIIMRAGGAVLVGRAAGVARTTVLSWDRIPPKHVPAISEAFGIPRHELRPDLWEAPLMQASAA